MKDFIHKDNVNDRKVLTEHLKNVAKNIRIFLCQWKI